MLALETHVCDTAQVPVRTRPVPDSNTVGSLLREEISFSPFVQRLKYSAIARQRIIRQARGHSARSPLQPPGTVFSKSHCYKQKTHLGSEVTAPGGQGP